MLVLTMRPPFLDLSGHVVRLARETDFAGWRNAARALALNGVPPEEIAWEIEESGAKADSALPAMPPGAELKVPKEFVERAEMVFCHSDPERFALLYRLLWRLHGEPNLLKIASDPDIRRFEAKEKAVRRDIHKMRAFVRFRKIGDGEDERYLAWFEPDHFIVERNAAFFVRRFTGMRWTILTPYASAGWDGEGSRSGQAPVSATRPRKTPRKTCGGPITRTSSTRRGLR